LWGDWSLSSDTNSGLARYWFAIGTNPCDSNIVAWTNNWGYDTAHVTNLTLSTGQMYYFSVRAENGAGLLTPCYSSDGVLVDLTTGIYSSSNGTIQAYVSPNPADGETALFYNLSSSQTVRIKIYNVNGQIVSDQNIDGIAGANKYEIRRTDILSPSGVYFISIDSNETSLIVPLLLK
jgi:hypothetical protein